MTLREAVAQAYREQGWSEEDIVKSLEFADGLNPESIEAVNKEVTPGKERDIIDCLKSLRGELDKFIDGTFVEFIEEFSKNNCLTSEGGIGKGPIKITPKEDFKPDSVDFVLCAEARPGAFRVQGTIDVECSDCKTMVILSPSSPVNKPRLCWKCALARTNDEQSAQE